MDQLWAFALLAVALSVTPGPDDVLVLRSSLEGGMRAGAATAFGAAVGSLTWGATTAVGLATVVSRSPELYDGIRLAGAGYLVVLGLAPAALAALARVRATASPGPVAVAPAASGLRSAFAAGLVSDLLNPKIGLFYVAVIPQFIPPGAPALGWTMLLCAIDVTVAVLWLLGVSCFAWAAQAWFQRPTTVRWTRAVLSLSLVLVGASVAIGF
jgi:threonine/homoserine/homoserine lactone efflux protein